MRDAAMNEESKRDSNEVAKASKVLAIAQNNGSDEAAMGFFEC
ncbi:hypothetical protein PI124_g8977 [Phytophthora idaei]|nr:hypothetical protein PI125_g19567 [Phytophthora idaei]KAG3139395.1 hypothetical protein PI126_g16475 [Phytophthora idaei]KAG3246290.1 hypothetical protein PI124_g8977 [Phytophthora idaei]